MEHRWNQLTEKLIASVSVREKWWNRICLALTGKEGRRHYYNLENLEKRFTLFETISHRLCNPQAVALAMFLQHLHYDPRLPGISEELTLATLEEFIADAEQAIPELISDLRELIEAALINSTPVHLTPDAVGSGDVHYFLDIDMAVLGSSSSEYAETLTMMREEYGFTSDVDYFELRLKVLRYFLQIPNIYATEDFRNRYNEKARDNIINEISNIEDRLKTIRPSP
ncbi:uncharacterized protein LOC124337857 [Daphnia pulicaria]|uniref:uncharacterized protein LOC124337857 n=1 Tax=Daphnia pulicaria TaxID=35523 RepID=UPI001EEA36CD|nr:uncharacterized protein LOC124337857 [Daphnia pulicaria]XP_046647826.1 uncharacterized protein LOC124337857 [Daphnia pulicaria]XP_046647827.1 uncharacterized protein LOC124337857 [Daphnia pulicaria]